MLANGLFSPGKTLLGRALRGGPMIRPLFLGMLGSQHQKEETV